MRSVAAWALVWTWSAGIFGAAPAAVSANGTATTPTWPYRVVATYPHDVGAFTEGLSVDRGRLIESTGRYGQSALTIRELSTGRILKSRPLDARDFGEGVAVVGSRIFQLTWKAGIGYVYDFDLHRVGSFPVSGEGWGLTYDGHWLIRSDGSAKLHLHDPKNFAGIRHIEVRDDGRPVDRLNELEFAKGRIYANVWLTDRIAVINPRSGAVIAWLDLGELKHRFPKPPNWNEDDNVLNGIAFDPRSGHFFVTGKCWPLIFEISIER